MRRRYLSIFLVLAVAVAMLFGAAYAEGGGSVVPLNLPEGYDHPILRSAEEGFFLTASGDTDTLVLLLDNNGAQLHQRTYPHQTSFSVSIANLLCVVSPRVASSSTFIGTYRSSGGKLFAGLSLSTKVDCREPSYTAMNRDGKLYLIDKTAPDLLYLYAASGNKYTTLPTERGGFTSVCVSPDSILYTTYSGESMLGMAPLSTPPEEDLPLQECDLPEIPYRFLNRSLAIDQTGGIFRVQEHSGLFTYLWKAQGDWNNACVLDGEVILQTDGSTAARYNETGEISSFYHFDGELLSFAGNGAVCAGITQKDNAFFFVPLGQAEEIPNESSQEPSSEPEPPESSELPESSEPPVEPESSEPGSEAPPEIDHTIRSETYPIDRNAQSIYVPSRTTFNALKQNLIVDEGRISAQKPNGMTLTSGYVTTGSILELMVDGQLTDGLSIIVEGDLTGTGSITSSDLRLLYGYLTGDTELSASAIQAADLDGDGQITTADLLVLKKKVKNPGA